MTTALRIWRERADPFSTIAAAATDWDAASPCTDWAARDVVAHVVETQRDFLQRHGLLAAGTPETGDPHTLWITHEAEVSSLMADPDVADRAFAGYFGPSTIGETLTGFYGVDMVTHRWDLAVSQGLDARLTDQDLEAIDEALDGFGEQAYAPGLFARPVPVPPDASRLQQVLARTGRRA